MFEKGLATRREVLSDACVDAALAKPPTSTSTCDSGAHKAAGGDVWTRPGLDRRTRSRLNLAMLTALNRPHELKIHLQGALNNGVTVDEIKEVLLHTAVYCGVSAAIDAFRVASQVMAEQLEPNKETQAP